ncbi:hypothetical protein [Candidatus Albibeggiatoa sp. nov. BB20]|uniref:hypothetical protein n=1 Tax=Candidatus Albibeggiatoa sp. nov. BB20 TaxID=3162723 RepID=UPI003365508B
MRIVIDAMLNCSMGIQKKFEDNDIIALFAIAGLSNRLTEYPPEMANKYIQAILEEMPLELVEIEKHQMVMLGFESRTRQHFLVSKTNLDSIAIRIGAPTVGVAVRTCENIYLRLKHQNLLIKPKVKANEDKKICKVWLDIDEDIKAIERQVGHEHPTFQGRILDNPFLAAFMDNRGEAFIIAFTCIISVALFLFTPTITPHFQHLLNNILNLGFDESYVRGSLERASTGFFLTFIFSTVNFFIRLMRIAKHKPIEWNLYKQA